MFSTTHKHKRLTSHVQTMAVNVFDLRLLILPVSGILAFMDVCQHVMKSDIFPEWFSGISILRVSDPIS